MDQPLKATLEKLMSEALGEAIQIQNAKMLGGGCISHASKLVTDKGDFFAKWNNNGPDDLFLREAECLEEMAKAVSLLKIPKVWVKTSLAPDTPALLITDFLSPARGSKSDQDETLGIGLAELHRYTSEKFGFYHNNYCGATLQYNSWNDNWIDFYGQQRIAALLSMIRERRDLSSGDIGKYNQLLEKLPELLAHKPDPVLIHGDLWSGNYMYSAAGPALIDPACCYADREFELSLMTMFGGFSDRVWAAYQEAYPLPADWKDRNNLYMLYHYINHYYLFGGHYGQQALNIVNKYI